MVYGPSHLAGVTNLLLQHGKVFLPESYTLRQGQSDMALFNDVGAQLQEILSDEDYAIELDEQEGGLLFTLKVGEAANEPPDFSPPEPRLW